MAALVFNTTQVAAPIRCGACIDFNTGSSCICSDYCRPSSRTLQSCCRIRSNSKNSYSIMLFKRYEGNCRPGISFHRGQVVVFRIAAPSQSVVSAQVLTPIGKSAVPVLLKGSSSQEWVVHYALPQNASAGMYRFVMKVQEVKSGRENSFTQIFPVIR